MKKKLILASMWMLAITAITVVSCSKDEELEDLYSLDVSSRTPLTRSSLSDFESVSGQTIGGSSTTYRTVPTNDNECMLWAIINVALAKDGGYVTIKGSKGEDKRVRISTYYTAEQYYNYVRNTALGEEYTTCDSNGNVTKKTWQGGSMTSELGARIAKNAGIMTGIVQRFNTYQELYDFISNPLWKEKHPDGTYIISNLSKKHAQVCTGTKNGEIQLKKDYNSDAPQDKKFTNEKNANDGYELVY